MNEINPSYSSLESHFPYAENGYQADIGIQLYFERERIFIATVRPGSPAHRANICCGDELLQIDFKDLTHWSGEQIISSFQGPEGSKIQLRILNKNNHQSQIYSLFREYPNFWEDLSEVVEEPEQNETVTDNEIVGIGIQIDFREGQLFALYPLPGGPAALAGVQHKDQILQIDSEEVKALTLAEIVAKIRGPRGTQVCLLIQHQDEAPVQFILTRDSFQVAVLDKNKSFEERLHHFHEKVFEPEPENHLVETATPASPEKQEKMDLGSFIQEKKEQIKKTTERIKKITSKLSIDTKRVVKTLFEHLREQEVESEGAEYFSPVNKYSEEAQQALTEIFPQEQEHSLLNKNSLQSSEGNELKKISDRLEKRTQSTIKIYYDDDSSKNSASPKGLDPSKLYQGTSYWYQGTTNKASSSPK